MQCNANNIYIFSVTRWLLYFYSYLGENRGRYIMKIQKNSFEIKNESIVYYYSN